MLLGAFFPHVVGRFYRAMNIKHNVSPFLSTVSTPDWMGAKLYSSEEASARSLKTSSALLLGCFPKAGSGGIVFAPKLVKAAEVARSKDTTSLQDPASQHASEGHYKYTPYHRSNYSTRRLLPVLSKLARSVPLKSVQTLYVSSTSGGTSGIRKYSSSASPSGASDRKSARTWPFIAFLAFLLTYWTGHCRPSSICQQYAGDKPPFATARYDTVSPSERVVLMMEGILSAFSSAEKPLLPPGSTVSAMSARRSFSSLLLITMSSTYASRLSSPHLLLPSKFDDTPLSAPSYGCLAHVTSGWLSTVCICFSFSKSAYSAIIVLDRVTRVAIPFGWGKPDH
ncbi:hypothetical protein Tco_0852730 [Tanacetum coccineum]